MPDRLKVKHIRTSQFGKDPSASTIDYGEIAINYNSGSTALYIRDNADNIVKFAPITVDSELDSGSTNPVANSAVTTIIYEDEEIVSAALNDLNDRKADKSYVDEAVSSITIAVDDHMDSASTNPVQNKVVKEYIDEAVSSITIDVDYRLDSGSTNPVANSAITNTIIDNELIVASALNDLNDRILEIAPNDGVLTIQKNGTTFGTFSANSESAVTVNMLVNEVPASTASDSGKVLMVNASGQPEWTLPSNIYSGNVTPSPQLGNNGDIYIQTT